MTNCGLPLRWDCSFLIQKQEHSTCINMTPTTPPPYRKTASDTFTKAIKREVNFKTFQPSPNNPNAVVSGLLFGMCEDKDGNLWIGSENNGISQYIRREGKCITHLHDPNNPNSPRTNNYRALFCDSDGKIWAGNSVFNPTTKQWRYFPIFQSRPNIEAYLEIGDTVYAFHGDTVYAVHRQTLKVSSFAIDMPGNVFGDERSIRLTQHPSS